MAIGKPLHLRLFLEGIEVPVISATVTSGTNAPASAAIQIVPLDSAIDFKPRTMVHLFFLDAKASKSDKGATVFSRSEGVYRLLFAGEMHGFQFVQTPMSRAVVLQCLDFSSYWDAAHATAIEYGPFGNMFAAENLSGGSTGLFDDIVNQQAAVIAGWIRQRPRTPGLQGVSGTAGGIIHMMEAMAGYSAGGKHTKGINDFFTVSELRCRLLQQMTAEENDSTAANLIGGQVFMEWLKGGLSNAGQQVTFRDMLLLLMQYIYYENVPISSPYWTETESGEKGTPTAQRLRTQIIRPDCWFTVPPACNIIFPEHFTQISYDRVWTKEVTRVLIHAYNSLIGKDALVNDTRILAPSDDGVVHISTVAASQSYRKLMKHEYHTGIIPREESLPDTFSVSVRDEAQSEMRGAHHSWSEKVALFHFFKYRYAPRQVQVAGRFNPYVVCGFPGVVLRAPYIPPPEKLAGLNTDDALYQFVNQNAEELGAPYHLIGLVNGVTHQINQEGGTTTISMHSARRHSGADDEFMSIVKGATKTKKVVVRVSLTSQMAQESDEAFNMLRDMTPQRPEPARPSSGKEVVAETSFERTSKNADGTFTTHKGTTKGKRKAAATSAVLPFTVRGTIPEAGITQPVLKPSADGQRITVGAKTGFFTNSEIVGIEVKVDPGAASAIETIERDGETVNLYRALVIYEKVEIPLPVAVPLESVLKPGWFSNAYDPLSVGKRVYQPFFGCDSILDAMSVSTGGQATKLRTWDGKLDAAPTVPAVSKGKVVGDVFVEDLAGKFNNAEDMTVERALNTLAFIYGRVKSSGQDVDDFIQQIIHRPIATKDQILGEEGIEVSLGPDGKPVVEESVWTGKPGEFRKGKLGFHTLALHPNMINHKQKLAGLLYDPELKMQRASGHGSKDPIEPAYDVRKEKWDRVKRYADILVGKRGVQGLPG